MGVLITHTLNGLSFAMFLFILASGITLIFGLMNIANMSHGAFYLLGAFVGLLVMKNTGNFLLAIPAAVFVGALGGFILERFLIKRITGGHLPQVLLTIGVALIFADLYLWLGQGLSTQIPKPSLLAGTIEWGQVVIPEYRLFVIIIGAIAATALWLSYEKTRVGAMIRAGVDDAEMARGVGLNIPLMFTAVFAFGASLAAFGGVIGGGLLGLYPGVDFDVLLLCVAIIVIGGMGSIKGALVGSLIVALIDNFGKVFFPEIAYFTIFAPVAIILLVRPQGLFGQR